MALPVLRGCYRVPSTFSFAQAFLKNRITVNQTATARRPLPQAAARAFSSGPGGEAPKQRVVVMGFPNPFVWLRSRVYYFLIRTYFDNDFSVEEFTEGSKQAFSRVSSLLSRCQFEALEGLVAKDLLGKLEEKCKVLSLDYQKALCADPDQIMYTTSGDVGVYYDNDGRKFVSILMRFWYLTNATLPDDTVEGARVFQVSIGEEGLTETKRLITANYEFQREFTKGVPADWTITRIEHAKLLD